MRQIIILETRKNQGSGRQNITGAMWCPIAATPAGARVPKTGFVSVCAGLTGAAAITTAEQVALEDGSVREEPFHAELSISATNTQIQQELIRQWNDRSAAIAAEPPPRQFYGVSWNGAAWGVGVS
jgi:hypothetical protein